VGYVPEELRTVKKRLDDNESSHEFATVRQLLWWFGAQRRGFWIVRRIQQALKPAGPTSDDYNQACLFNFVVEPRLSAGRHQSAGKVTKYPATRFVVLRIS
jgi:hypothetical protein